MHPTPRPRMPPRRHVFTHLTSKRSFGLVCLGLALAMGAQAQTPTPAERNAVWVGRFDGAADDWRDVAVKAELKKNRFGVRRWDGVDALEVHSSASMSLKARPLSVDLDATPVLCWRWRIDAPIAGADMSQRRGDDYAARVYVSFKLPESAIGFGLRTQLSLGRAIWGADLPDAALNYVWDNQNPIGTERPNAYTDRAMMVVLRSGAADARQWVSERRNIKDDVARLFAPGARAVQLAVTADSDNTGQTAHAGFADFHFVPAAAACQFPS